MRGVYPGLYFQPARRPSTPENPYLIDVMKTRINNQDDGAIVGGGDVIPKGFERRLARGPRHDRSLPVAHGKAPVIPRPPHLSDHQGRHLLIIPALA